MRRSLLQQPSRNLNVRLFSARAPSSSSSFHHHPPCFPRCSHSDPASSSRSRFLGDSYELLNWTVNLPRHQHFPFGVRGSAPRAQTAVSMAASEAGGPPAGYRPNVGLCLVNEKDEVFVASRLDLPDSWQMPQGGVDDGEDPRDAAVRELREETGVTSVQLLGEVKEWLTYDFPPDVKLKITKLWGREWTGQAQKWFLFRFMGEDTEINLAGDGTEVPEFGQWKWLPVEEVLKAAVDFKKPVYAQAFKSLCVHVPSWAAL